MVANMSEPSTASDREIVSVRTVNFPRDTVFRAYTEPGHVVRWWGPRGFTNTFHEFDARPGGVWRFVMHGPDGGDYKNEIHFIELLKPERVVLDHVSAPKFRATVLLAGRGNKTEISYRMLFETAALCDKVKSYAVEANEQNFDRLEAELHRMDQH